MNKYFAKILPSILCLFVFMFAVSAPVSSRSLVYFGLKENEEFAVKTIKTVAKLQKQYAENHQGKFASNFDELIAAENLDENLHGEIPVVHGYAFNMKTEDPRDEKPGFYLITADPEREVGPDKTGSIHFYFDSTLKTIKVTSELRQASAVDPSI